MTSAQHIIDFLQNVNLSLEVLQDYFEHRNQTHTKESTSIIEVLARQRSKLDSVAKLLADGIETAG